MRVNAVQQLHKVVELRVQLAQRLGSQMVRFRPVRTALVPEEDGLEALKQQLVRHVQTVRSIITIHAAVSIMQSSKYGVCYALVLHNADPAGLLSIAGAEPNIIRV